MPVGLVTNVTNIPNFISAKFEDMKYFKKVSGRPLILFYNYSFEIDYNMKSNYIEEVLISDVHYKYNFRIQPSKFEGHISVKENGTNILLSYPQELIYNYDEKTYKIMYIINEPSFADKISLNQDSYDLYCRNLNKMKICDVPKSHFDGKQSGNYYTGEINYNYQYRFRPFYDSSPIKVTKPIEMNIIQDSTIYIGNKGKLYLRTDYNDTNINIFNDSNIEENTKFNISFSCGDKIYSDISCNLWKDTENIIYIFCQLSENLNDSNRYINVNRTILFYNNLEIPIKQKYENSLYFIQLERSIPFLYSKSQTINIEEEINTYYLKFNAENYQNEKLIIRPYSLGLIILDDCSIEKKELTCRIGKSELEEYNLLDTRFGIYYPYSDGPFINSRMIDKLIVDYKSPKIFLKISIFKLLGNYIDQYDFFAYEVKTNATNISNLVSNMFELNFEYDDRTRDHACFFKKTNGNPLYLLCEGRRRNSSIYLSEIENEIKLNDIHGKYNFYIQPVRNNDIINVMGRGSNLFLIMPKTLDFSTNDNISIELVIEDLEYSKGIRFNLNATEDLKCENINTRFKRCVVPKNHFENEQSGYYNTYHLNSKNEYIKYYEYSPIQVILQSEVMIKIEDIDDKNPVTIGHNGAISFMTDFKDLDNIFNPLDIEIETANEVKFSDNYNENYFADCRLWKPIGEYLRLICKFKGNINAQKIKLNQYSFEYKDYKIIIVSEKEFRINQLDTVIPFLYSDKQVINIIDNNEYNLMFEKEIYNKESLTLNNQDNMYELKFKIEEYYNEPLYIYGINNNYAILDNCEKIGKELICKISKEKLEEILVQNKEQFKIGAMNENYGIISFRNKRNNRR